MCTIVVIHVHVHCNLKIKTIVTFTLTKKRLKFDTLKLSVTNLNYFGHCYVQTQLVLVFQEPYPTYDPVLYTKPLDEYKDSVQTLVDPDFIE